MRSSSRNSKRDCSSLATFSSTEGGDRDKLGRGAIWTATVAPRAYQNHIFRVRFTGDEYCPKLFHYLIQSWQAKRYFFSHAKQTNNLCTINSRELKEVPVAIPSPGEQARMVELLDGSEAEVEAARERITALVRLKQSFFQNLLQAGFAWCREPPL